MKNSEQDKFFKIVVDVLEEIRYFDPFFKIWFITIFYDFI